MDNEAAQATTEQENRKKTIGKVIIITICILNVVWSIADIVIIFVSHNSEAVRYANPWAIVITFVGSLLLYQGLPAARWYYAASAFVTSLMVILVIPQAVAEGDVSTINWVFLIFMLIYNACSVWLLFSNKAVEEFLYEKEVDWHERVGKNWKW